MVDKNYRDYFSRPIADFSINEHQQNISCDFVSADSKRFNELYSDCFQHHVEPHLVASGESLEMTDDQSEKRWIQSDTITAYFLKNIYDVPLIHHSENINEIDLAHSTISYSDMVKAVTGSPVSDEFSKTGNPGSNRINFLIGDIGIGKSLLSSKIINDVREQSNAETSCEVIPVYLDCETTIQKFNQDFGDIDDAFYSRVYEEIRIAALREGVSASDLPNHDEDYPAYSKIRELAKSMLSLDAPRRIFLTIDNLDRYHFFYSNYAFFDDFRERQLDRVDDNINGLIVTLSDNQHLGDCGMCVLIACRHATLNCFRSRLDELDYRNAKLKDFGAYAIDSTTDLGVLNSRFKLLRDCIDVVAEKMPAKKTRYIAALERIEKAFRKSLTTSMNKENSLRTISDLSHQGARSFLNFVRDINIDLDENSAIADRLFVAQPHNLLRTYISNLKKRYCEAEGHFPNLFLIDSTVRPDRRFESAHEPHRHTYWLKYLLLKFIVTNTNGGSRKEFCTVKELEEIFVDSLGYEPHIFKLALGYLYSPNNYRCIKLDEPITGPTLKIAATSRGKTLLRENIYMDINNKVEFCFDFDYLQFVVDDYELSLPAPFRDNIYVHTNLGYLFRAGAIYGGELRGHIIKKISAVANFVAVLEASLSMEKTIRLQKDKRILALCPDFDAIYEVLISTYIRITQDMTDANILVANARKIVDELKSEKGFDEFFRIYLDPDQPLVTPS